MKGFVSALACILLVCGCSSSRLLPYKYEDVSLAVAERFAVNEWTEFYTKKSMTKEKAGTKTVFTHYDWSYHDYKIMCEIQVENSKGGMAEIYVFVRDWNSWFSPLIYSPSYARQVLDIIEKRMQDGSWPEDMPWRKGEKL